MGFLGVLHSRWDWAYLLSLLVPFAVYNLTLKVASVFSRAGGHGLARTLGLVRSDAFFNLGYALLWIRLFATARGGPMRPFVVVFFHLTSVLVAIIRTAAHQYHKETGTTLDYDIVALWLPRFEEVKPMIKLPLLVRVLLFAVLFYAALGPLFVARAARRWRGWARRSVAETPKASLWGSLGLYLMALGLGSLSVPTGSIPPGTSRSFARDPLVNLLLTGIKEAITKDGPYVRAVKRPAANIRLAQTPGTKKRNVVLIHLESTRARSVTPYNESLGTTPFLDDLAEKSLLVERAYTTIPNTLKASVSVNCGIEPSLRPGAEVRTGVIPARCLASLLEEQGYNTAFFQSSTENFENFRNLAKRLGYENYYPLESMDEEHKEGFEWTNYFGYEDDIMLRPSEEWLEKHKDEPFMIKYLTGTGHHDYYPPSRYGMEDFSEDDRLNRYLNCLRYQDFFVRNLFDQYKSLDLYEETIFVIYGDHGEGFGEHGRYVHEDNPYEDALRVPLLIHAPGWFDAGERCTGLSNLTDILPTVVEMLGYETENGEYPGYSLLRPLPDDRTLMFSCFNKDKCLGSIKGSEKYIYHYGNQPDELYDLSKDPFERRNLAGERPEEVKERREALLGWRSSVNVA